MSNIKSASTVHIQKNSTLNNCPILLKLKKYIEVNNVIDMNKALVQLKKDSKCWKKFVEADGLDILVKLLYHKSHSIVNLSLSILANVCMTRNVREKVKNSNIGSNVISIIKNIKLNGKLHCRACRLIGNLSECNWHANNLYDAGVVEALVTVLKSKPNVSTSLMAVRAIRNIWTYHKDGRQKMITEFTIVKLVAEIFVMAMERSVTDVMYVNLVNMCLKVMHIFLIKLDSRCGLQIQLDDHQGYKCLIQCCSTDLKYDNKMAFKCVYSLCQIAECRLLLGTCGMIEQLIILIDSLSNTSGHLSEEILVSLGLFCWEAVNRAKITNNNGLQIILKVLKMPEYERYHPMLLQALVQFYYDDIAIDILAKHGLIEILTMKLTNMVAVAMIDKGKTWHNIQQENLSTEKSCKSLKENCLSRFSMDSCRLDWSPRSVYSSGYSSSPPRTPTLSYYDFTTESDDMNDDIYSPVCSDTEYENNDNKVVSLKSCASMTIDTDNSNHSDTSNKTNTRNISYSTSTLTLLHKLSMHFKPIDKLVDPIMIKPLLAYIKYTKSTKASEIFIKIIREPMYFVPLIKQGIVFELQNLSKPEQYMQPLMNMAETGGSIGQLSSILLRDEEEQKMLIAVSIPILIKSRFNLAYLLRKNGGLKFIFYLLTNLSHSLHEWAIWSICQLAKTLLTQPEAISNRSNIAASHKLDYHTTTHLIPTESSMVTFELDDGTTVEANRETLCQRSDVFCAMLKGNFQESGKKQVRLRHTSANGLKMLITMINGTALEYKNIESMLDAAVLADKFLMPDLSDTLIENFMANLNHESFYRVWYWTKKNFCDDLRLYCIKKFLTTKMSWSKTMYAFQGFYTSEIFEEFLHEIRELIVGALCRI